MSREFSYDVISTESTEMLPDFCRRAKVLNMLGAWGVGEKNERKPKR